MFYVLIWVEVTSCARSLCEDSLSWIYTSSCVHLHECNASKYKNKKYGDEDDLDPAVISGSEEKWVDSRSLL